MGNCRINQMNEKNILWQKFLTSPNLYDSVSCLFQLQYGIQLKARL